MNRGVVYALWDYEPQSDDELGFSEGDCVTVLRREDEAETEWWWARCGDREGYIPRNLLGVSSLEPDYTDSTSVWMWGFTENIGRIANRLMLVHVLLTCVSN